MYFLPFRHQVESQITVGLICDLSWGETLNIFQKKKENNNSVVCVSGTPVTKSGKLPCFRGQFDGKRYADWF